MTTVEVLKVVHRTPHSPAKKRKMILCLDDDSRSLNRPAWLQYDLHAYRYWWGVGGRRSKYLVGGPKKC